MFDNGSRYITRGVENKIPLDLQIFNIAVVDEIENKVRIIHSQEVPEYKKIWIVNASEPCDSEKIFVIDDNTHSTMLLAEEY